MANITINCPLPFLDLSAYPYTGGFQAGRLCAPFVEGAQCCLPCPLTDWVYPDNFNRLTGVANWLNVGSLSCCAVLLLTLLVLPIQKTSRHYLTICLILAVGFMNLAFIIPLGSKPHQCHDAITPNDIHSDLSCAFSGSFVVFGGFTAVMWVFLRSLSLHLQICWQVIPGKKFFWIALVAGWAIPAISLALVIVLTGMSYRFGQICHTNHTNSIATFWGPLLAFAGSCAVLQIATLVYCMRVYIRSLMNPEEFSQNSSNLPSYHGSVKTVTAAAAYRRIKKVIVLQWRGIVIVGIIVANVVFFSIIFITMDNATTAATENIQVEFAWVLCLFTSSGDKDKCLPLTKSFVMNEATVMAVLYMLSLNGYWCVLFLGRYSMVTGWWETIKAPFNRSHDFVSVDARRVSDPRNYEMLTSPPQPMMHKTIEDVESSPDTENHSARDWEVKNTREVSFGSEATYRSPALSFSSPKPPSRSASIEATRHGSSHGRSKDVTSWETDRVASPPILERYEPSSNRQSPILRTERSGSVMGSEQSDSALGRQHSGSALLREKNTRSPPQRSGISPASHLGREWDPRSTYARGAGVRTPERGGQPWNPSQTTYVRGGEGAPL